MAMVMSRAYHVALILQCFSPTGQPGTIGVSNRRSARTRMTGMSLPRNNSKRRTPAPRMVRRSLALLCVLIGVAGCILPIIPGLPFFVVAARLLGRRDRQVRRAIVGGRLAL